MRIGVLALQGAFFEHIETLKKLGVEAFEIRRLSDIDKPFDGLILPGGESTAISLLLKSLNLLDKLKGKINNGLPVFGTCAGMILLAKEFCSNNGVCFGTMDICVKRNAYGRQLGSFFAEELFNGKKVPMRFIRAPYIEKVGKDVEVLSVVDGKIVAARQNNQLVTSFHPELEKDCTVYRYFLDMI